MMTLEQELFAIEQGFWLSGTEHFMAHLDAQCILALPQAGEMHGLMTREAIARTATSANRWRELRMTERSILQPSEELAILTYRADVMRADGQPYAALIGSAYIRRDDGWKLIFHQHSPL